MNNQCDSTSRKETWFVRKCKQFSRTVHFRSTPELWSTESSHKEWCWKFPQVWSSATKPTSTISKAEPVSFLAATVTSGSEQTRVKPINPREISLRIYPRSPSPTDKFARDFETASSVWRSPTSLFLTLPSLTPTRKVWSTKWTSSFNRKPCWTWHFSHMED